MLVFEFAEFLCQGLSLSFIAQCLSHIKGGLCLAGCHVVAQTQGYHLACILGGLFKSQGVELFKSLMCFCTVVQLSLIHI